MHPGKIPCIVALIGTIYHVAEASTNIALRKNATLCDEKTSHLITDGDKSVVNFEMVESNCLSEPYVTINLLEDYLVHYVVVYEGVDWNDVEGNALDFFRIINYVRGERHDCAEYPKKSVRNTVDNSRGMRVNCELSPEVDAVQLKTKTRKSFYVTEIEVHTFASGISEEGILMSYGCVSNFESSVQGISSLEFCRNLCIFVKAIFIAIKERNNCNCGSNYDEKYAVNDSMCHYKCDNTTLHFCGGDDVYSIYLVNIYLPRYAGCVEYQSTFGDYKRFTLRSMNITKCLHFCETSFYALMTNGSLCLCSDQENITNGKTDVELCSVPCPGDSESFCGAEDYVSVYKTCSGDIDLPTKCSSLFYCSWNEYGECPQGCKKGYSGQHCFTKDFPQRNVTFVDLPVIKTSNTYFILFFLLLLLALLAIFSLFRLRRADTDESTDSSSSTVSNIPSPIDPAVMEARRMMRILKNRV